MPDIGVGGRKHFQRVPVVIYIPNPGQIWPIREGGTADAVNLTADILADKSRPPVSHETVEVIEQGCGRVGPVRDIYIGVYQTTPPKGGGD